MSKKRVHEIAKEHGLSSKELLEKLRAAGVEAKAAASSVEESTALEALGLSPNGPASANGGPGAGADSAGSPSQAAAAKTPAPAAPASAAQRPPTAAPLPAAAAPT